MIRESRRGIAPLGLGAALALGCSLHAGTATAVAQLAAYACPVSVDQGDSVTIHVSTDAPAFDLRIMRDAASPQEVLLVRSLPGRQYAVPERVWEAGCGWPAAFAFAVPRTWPSGMYLCQFLVDSRILHYAIFTVCEDEPGSTASILFLNAVSTWQAYNGWGGKSLYDFNSGGDRAHVVSYQRPHAISLGLGDYYYAERPFVRWLDAEGIAVEFATDLDAHADAQLLDAYALLLIVGHDEYWSLEQRNHVAAYVAGGGNLAIFAGNTCWTQIRLSAGLDQITCYKDRRLDPLTGIDDRRVTVPWYEAPVSWPENSLTGVSWRNGGFVNFDGWYPAAEGYGGYTAYHTDHWVYAGTRQVDGAQFGQASTIVGYETDGALFTWEAGSPVVTGADSTPPSYRILALSPAHFGHATMGIFTAGGTVFNAATTDWAHGLANDPTVATITRNVLNRLSMASLGGASAAATGVRMWSTPNPGRSVVHLFWRGDVGRVESLTVYALDGRRIAALGATSDWYGGRATWDGYDACGRRVANGTYLIHLEAKARSLSSRVTLVR